jgi:alpha-amylase
MTTTTGKNVANPGGGVMMQAFTGMYLLAETGGIQGTKVTAWSNAGIGSIWLPPVSKAQNGPFSMDMILLIILILETTIKMEL